MVTRAVARAGLPERAEGRAQLGPTPPDLRSPDLPERSLRTAKDPDPEPGEVSADTLGPQ